MSILKKYLLLFALFLVFSPTLVKATEVENFKLDYNETAFTASTTLNIVTNKVETGLPWEWQAISLAYDYSISSSGIYNPGQPLKVKINYEKVNNFIKQIFVYDNYSSSWQPLITTDNPRDKSVTAELGTPVGRLIVLANPDILAVGKASWYKFKGGLFTASPDFAKGSILRVYNVDNNKSVDVVVNDWGPDRSLHPDRVVDLDYQAFEKIAATGAGIINVRIEPIKIVVSDLKKEQIAELSEPNISSPSAIIMEEKSKKIMWGKQENRVAPLASLTKLVAVKVFLDTKISLAKIVSYDKKDEELNYNYCSPGESSRLKIKHGDKVKIEDLIYSSLVGSANNTIETLVRVSGLKRDKFIEQMNSLVHDWGATSTKFIEPTGLSSKNVSSPFDYAIITKEIFSDPFIKKVSVTRRYTVKTINTKTSHTLINTNQLLPLNKYPIIGSKTGYLKEAGHCLMTRIESAKGNFIVVNFGAKSALANFSDNEQLIRYGFRLQSK